MDQDLAPRIGQCMAQALASVRAASPAQAWQRCLRALQADTDLQAHVLLWQAGGVPPPSVAGPRLRILTATSAPGRSAAHDLLGAAACAGPPALLVELAPGCAGMVDMTGLACLVDCHVYEPAFAGELQAIVLHAVQQAMAQHPCRPCYLRLGTCALDAAGLRPTAPADAVAGLSLLRSATGPGARVQILGGGDAMEQVLRAGDRLGADHGVAADLWCVTSFSELARRGLAPLARGANGAPDGPVLGVTGRSRLLPELLRAHMPAGHRYATLGLPFPREDAFPAQPHPDDVPTCDAIVQAALSALQPRTVAPWQRPLSDAELVSQSCI